MYQISPITLPQHVVNESDARTKITVSYTRPGLHQLEGVYAVVLFLGGWQDAAIRDNLSYVLLTLGYKSHNLLVSIGIRFCLGFWPPHYLSGN
ncbi:MAG: hypothetical protein JO235_10755 [Chroococcidiopsidaceae cyanobacterium CP_BM_RX_35]|nr:hypothetical protein [Chroococcidiopsidaceae cyanobacterium CP_BM_RX_35]